MSELDDNHPCLDCDVVECTENEMLECEAFRRYCYSDVPKDWTGEMQGKALRENVCMTCEDRETGDCAADRGSGGLCKKVFKGKNYKGAGRPRKERSNEM